MSGVYAARYSRVEASCFWCLFVVGVRASALAFAPGLDDVTTACQSIKGCFCGPLVTKTSGQLADFSEKHSAPVRYIHWGVLLKLVFVRIIPSGATLLTWIRLLQPGVIQTVIQTKRVIGMKVAQKRKIVLTWDLTKLLHPTVAHTPTFDL